MMCDFPWYFNIKTKKQIKSDFLKLTKQKLSLINIKKAQDIVNDFRFDKCGNEYVIYLDNYNKNKSMHFITNYFSEKCRMKCKKHNKDKSPFDKAKEIKYKNREDLLEILWKQKYMCQLFKTTVVRQLYLYFKAKNVLDFSAGWGDRLIASRSLGLNYTGVDPSICMKPIYNNIIKETTNWKKGGKCKIISKPFENVKLKYNSYDLIFSSPPFFALEIYEKDNIQQSISKYKNIDVWKKKFLYVLINKCYNYLKLNGYFCIHISDYGPYTYVKDMLNYIKNNTKFKYYGKFYYLYKYSEKVYSRPVFIRIYKKL
jgi:hypothetical protein